MIIQPRSIVTEQGLLAACMMEGVSPPCEPSDFSLEEHRIMAAAMREIEGEGGKPDMVTIQSRMKQGQVSASFIADVFETVASPQNLEAYALIVKSYSVARATQIRAANFIQAINASEGQDLEKIVDAFNGDILAISSNGNQHRSILIGDALTNWIARLDEKMAQPGMAGISTGITKLDQLTGGMCGQEMWVIGARPSIGKTAFSLNLLVHCARSRVSPIYFFSLDMSREKIIERIVAQLARIDLWRIRTGSVSNEEYQAILGWQAHIRKFDLILHDGIASELDILRECRRTKPRVVFIDYFTKIRNSKPTSSRYGDFSRISGAVKAVGKELNIPVVMMAQLNRNSENEKRAPILSDLKETGSVEEDAAVVLFIHSDKNDRAATRRTILLAKQQQGETSFWDMEFDGPHQRFESLVDSYEPKSKENKRHNND